MNIEEARRVCWLKSNPRPVGELLDEGVLGQKELEWASRWAYNPQLKEAAQVLLQAMQNAIPKEPAEPSPSARIFELKMTLEQAKATLWPFAPYKGQPIGTLLDSKKIALKDLGYAIENARDKRVKQAAIALALARLEQEVLEPKSKGPVQIFSGGRSFAERKQMQLNLLDGVVAGFTLGCFFIATILIFITNSSNRTSQRLLSISSPNDILMLVLGIIFVIALVVAPLYLVDLIEKRIDRLIDEYRRGQEGEEKVFRTLIRVLDGDWCICRNIYLPGRTRGDLDFILIGPPGIWVLEVKNWTGKCRNVGDRWEYYKRGKWRKARSNPSRQAIKNAVRLSNFLKAAHINVFVNPAVVWANQENQLHIENPITPIWLYDQLPEEVGNIWQTEKLSIDEREKIISKLANLHQQPS